MPPQLVPSDKLQKILGRPVNVTVNDGETLEQAEQRVSASPKFQSVLSGAALPAVPKDVNRPNSNLEDTDAARLLGATGGNLKKAAGYLGVRKDIEELKKPEQQRDKIVAAGKVISELMKRLDKIPSGEGPISAPLIGGYQDLVSRVPGIDENASSYRQGLRTAAPILMNAMDETRKTPQMLEAVQHSLPQLFSSGTGRSNARGLLQQIMQANTGFDWSNYIYPKDDSVKVAPKDSGQTPAIPEVTPHPMDDKALEWAQKNLHDPMAIKILQANGVMK